MISSPSGQNAVIQLNTGLGKSSVIVPIVTATLVNKNKACSSDCSQASSNANVPFAGKQAWQYVVQTYLPHTDFLVSPV